MKLAGYILNSNGIYQPFHYDAHEENIKSFLQRTEKVLDKIGKSHEILFALDPSLDNSENII